MAFKRITRGLCAVILCAGWFAFTYALQLPGPQGSPPVGAGSIGTTQLADGAVTNAKVNASAAIAGSKLNFATTDASDTANVVRKNAVNAFSVAGHSIAMVSNDVGINYTHTGANTFGYPLTAPGITTRYFNSGTGQGYVALGDGTNTFIEADGGTSKIGINSGGVIGFSQAAGSPLSFLDAGVSRRSAGVIELNNGTLLGGGALGLNPTTTPAQPADGSATMYVKGGKLVVRYNNAATDAYFYLDMTQAATAVWTNNGAVAP